VDDLGISRHNFSLNFNGRQRSPWMHWAGKIWQKGFSCYISLRKVNEEKQILKN
jgi:hypothetical protein